MAVKLKKVHGIRINGVLHTLICGSCKKVQPDAVLLLAPGKITRDPCAYCDSTNVKCIKLGG